MSLYTSKKKQTSLWIQSRSPVTSADLALSHHFLGGVTLSNCDSVLLVGPHVLNEVLKPQTTLQRYQQSL